MNRKAQISLVFLFLFSSIATQTFANISQTGAIESNHELIPPTDTIGEMREMSPIATKTSNVIINKQVKEWSNERFINLGYRTQFDTTSVLILVNRKKVNYSQFDLHPNMIKSLELLKKDDIPKRYKRKGITGVIKITTKKEFKSSN